MNDIFVARQPIYDANKNVQAYELLYRNSLEQNVYSCVDGDQATSSVIINSFLSIGIKKLTYNKTAFINFTSKLLKEDIPTLFPNQKIVVEIIEDIDTDYELKEACKRLKKLGYTIALDDFVFENIDKYKDIIKYIDIIKVDFLQSSHEERAKIVDRFQDSNIRLLAEKVETKKDFKTALEMGYSYFQGYYFSKPNIISGKDVCGYSKNCFEMLDELEKPDPSFFILEEIVQRDVSMSYRLLRLVNSAYYHSIKEIKSIKQALLMIGFSELRKFVLLILMHDINKNTSDEIMRKSLIRGKFAELIAPEVGLGYRRSETFIMGIFSLLDSLLKESREKILNEVPLGQDLKDALLGKDNELSDILKIIKSYEKGDWRNFSILANKLDIDEKKIPPFYFKSVEWTNNTFNILKNIS